MKVSVPFFRVLVLMLSSLLLTTGCSPVRLMPQASGQTVYITPIDGTSAQIVVIEAFQAAVVTQRPTYGQSWKARDLEIHIGKPMTEAILSYVSAQVPDTRIGNRHDGRSATVIITPSLGAIEFGVDDKKAVNNMALAGILASGSKATIGAVVHLNATIQIEGRSPQRVSIRGTGEKVAALISMTEKDAADTIGMAIDSAAKQLGNIVAVKLREG